MAIGVTPRFDPAAEGRPPAMKRPATLEPSPSSEERGGFRRVTITMPPEIYARLVRESARRKIAGEPNQLLSTLLREAVTKYLERLDESADPSAGPAIVKPVRPPASSESEF
jgi:hypothetical protein